MLPCCLLTSYKHASESKHAEEDFVIRYDSLTYTGKTQPAGVVLHVCVGEHPCDVVARSQRDSVLASLACSIHAVSINGHTQNRQSMHYEKWMGVYGAAPAQR